MQLTRDQPDKRQPFIQSYAEGVFRVSGVRHHGSVLILPETIVAWPVEDMTGLSLDSLAPVFGIEPPIEMLIIGCGGTFARPPAELVQGLRPRGIGIETMATGAACRTYNVLAGESRRIAAALIALRG